MKYVCSRCRVGKESTDFYKDARNIFKGVASRCKECMKELQRERNKTKIYTIADRERSRRWDASNKEKNRARAARRMAMHPEAVRAAWKKWQDAHPERKVRYRNGIRIATPKFAKPELMKIVMKKAKQLGFTVDHIVPIVHPLVCGLHSWDNLQLMDGKLNSAKGNKWWPDMPNEVALSSSQLAAMTV